MGIIDKVFETGDRWLDNGLQTGLDVASLVNPFFHVPQAMYHEAHSWNDFKNGDIKESNVQDTEAFLHGGMLIAEGASPALGKALGAGELIVDGLANMGNLSGGPRTPGLFETIGESLFGEHEPETPPPAGSSDGARGGSGYYPQPDQTGGAGGAAGYLSANGPSTDDPFWQYAL